MKIKVTIQFASSFLEKNFPSCDIFKQFVKEAVVIGKKEGTNRNLEFNIRFVNKKESSSLNLLYRKKPYPTNVLSFAHEFPSQLNLPLCGDLVICVPILKKEASEQHKSIIEHAAHLIVHGVLHILGYDHDNDKAAEEMEELETIILDRLGFQNPYFN